MEVVETKTRVRYGETDRMGVVYHANYFVYFNLGRAEFLRARGCPISELEKRGFILPVVEATIRLKASARYDDAIVIRTSLEKATKYTLIFRTEVAKEDGNVLLAKGTVTLACATREGKLQKIPADLAQALGAEGPHRSGFA